MAYTLSDRSKRALYNVHPDLVNVVQKALSISEQDFTVVEGVRSIETQRKYFNKGASKTMKSKHLVQPDGYGHAVDLYPYYDRSVQCEAPFAKFKAISKAMFAAAKSLGVKIRWGADWNRNGRTDDERFVDSPHFEYEGRE